MKMPRPCPACEKRKAMLKLAGKKLIIRLKGKK